MGAEKNEILLESGTNEIEVMEFTISNVLYGINVAKVLEIMLCEPVKFMPPCLIPIRPWRGFLNPGIW